LDIPKKLATLLWNVHMKDEAALKKFRVDLGRKGVYPPMFFKECGSY
jgi:hypothetical protein